MHSTPHHLLAGAACACFAVVNTILWFYFIFFARDVTTFPLLHSLESIVAVAISSILTYRLLFHPLAKYPGPLWAACTDWYTVYWIANGGRHLELHKQHKKHGKYVRFGPNRVSINSPKAAHELHDTKANMVKSDVYSAFKAFFGAEMSLTTVDRRVHSFRRRVNKAGLTPTAVKALEPHIKPHLDYFLDLIGSSPGSAVGDEAGWGPSYNMAEKISYLIADIMGDCTFGRNWATQKDPEYRKVVKDLPQGVAGMHLVGYMQGLFFGNMHKIIFQELIKGVGSLMKLSRGYALWRLEQTDLANPDIFSVLLAAEDPKTGAKFTKEELISEASLLIVGGTDSMVTATSATLFYLLHNPHVVEKLRCIIRETFPLPHVSHNKQVSHVECPIRFASPELQKLTYLTACIDESLRLSPPVSSILPRKVGPGGIVLDGEFFPAGTDLGIPHYSLHRSEEFWAEPLRFVPERWLPEERVWAREKNIPLTGRETTKAGDGHGMAFTPFGEGRSSCIGMYLAYQMMSIILARMIWYYDMRLDPTSTLGQGSGTGPEGRQRKDEYQLKDRFVSMQEGPSVQFRVREELKAATKLT